MVSIMPCTAKKLEAERPEFNTGGVRHIDYVLTTRELGRLFRAAHIRAAALPEGHYDDPMGIGSGEHPLRRRWGAGGGGGAGSIGSSETPHTGGG
jgi:NADH-quinone oxidoreductase subunit G/NADP-reducing hydrogenase subunit HndD